MILNLGCGKNKLKDYINIDIDPSVKPDIVADINIHLPYETESVFGVRCFDILEHLDMSGIYEIHRILQKDGILEFRVPHVFCRTAFNDFTHKHFFNSTTFYNSIFANLFQILELKVWYDFGNHRISIHMPLKLVRLHERLCPGILPPSHIQGYLKKK